MKPYYEDEYVTLYHGDCLEVDAWLEADVLVTDPPYGVAFRSARRSEQDRFSAIAGDESVALRDEVLAKWGSRPALVFGTWRAERPANVRQRLIWAKGEDPGLGDLSMPWGFGDEEMYVLGEGWAGKRRTNVYRMPKVAAVNNPGHPTPKPIPLMESLLDDGTPPDWVVADPFAGSGATLIAARNLGRKVIGVELEEKYCEVIAKRLQATPLPLLVKEPEAPATMTAAFDFGERLHPANPEFRSSGWSQTPN